MKKHEFHLRNVQITNYVLIGFFSVTVFVFSSSCEKIKGVKNKHSTDSSFSVYNREGCLQIPTSKNKFKQYLVSEIKGENEEEVVAALGKPSRIELYERGQKFFFFDVNCDSTNKPNYLLKIRINALGLANEILVLNL